MTSYKTRRNWVGVTLTARKETRAMMHNLADHYGTSLGGLLEKLVKERHLALGRNGIVFDDGADEEQV